MLGTALPLVAAMAVPAVAFWPVGAETATELHADVLGAPRVTVTASGTALTLHLTAPNTGPAPTGYIVRHAEGGRTHQVCELAAPGPCTDQLGAPATARTYTVSATLGSHWVHSTTIRAATPPSLHLSDLVLANGSGTLGRADAGDTVTWTFDRPVDPRSACAAWGQTPRTAHRLNVSVTVTAAPESRPDEQAVLAVAPSPSEACGNSADDGLHLGRLQVPRGYLSGDVLAFANSSLEIGADRRSITLTLGTPGEGAAEEPVPPAAVTFVPAVPGPTDRDGAALAATAVSGTPSSF